MIMRVTCPNPECAAVSNVEKQSLGRRGQCQRCGYVFELARPDDEPASAMSVAISMGANSSPQPPAGPLNLPEQFGRYRIMRLLGQGGMGAVYLGHDTKLDRQVAIKVPFFGPTDGPEAILRFEREAKSAATLDHPNLCPVHDVGEFNGIHYLTMPYIEGKSLSAVIAKDKVRSEQGAAAVVRKLALAVQVAHEKGIIHRDLKPGNVLISKHRELVITDFGLARRDASDDSPLTRTGMALGTALYMAPEQAVGDQALIGPRCDIYSLGVILYEMLTGVRPFEGPWAVVIGLKSVMAAEPPSKHRPDLTPALVLLCMKAIAKNPEDRFASMTEFASALGEFIGNAAVALPITPPDGKEVQAPSTPDRSLAEQFLAGLITTDEPFSLRSEPLFGHTGASRAEAAMTKTSKRMGLLIASGVTVVVLAIAASWMGGVFKMKTPEGTIVIQDLPKDAVLEVNDKIVTVTPRPDGKSFTVTTVAGENKLKITWDGTEVFGETVKVAASGETQIRVTLEKVIAKNAEKDAKPRAVEAELGEPSLDLASLGAKMKQLPQPVSFGSPWIVVGDELVSNPQNLVDHGSVHFGDPRWQEYNFHYKIKMLKKVGYVNARFHIDDRSFRAFELGGYDNSAKDLYNVKNGKWNERLGGAFVRPGIDFDRWYDVQIQVRKGFIVVLLDGEKIVEGRNDDYQFGRLGFSYFDKAQVAIKEVEVKTPAGDWLWKGVVELSIPTPNVKK